MKLNTFVCYQEVPSFFVFSGNSKLRTKPQPFFLFHSKHDNINPDHRHTCSSHVFFREKKVVAHSKIRKLIGNISLYLQTNSFPNFSIANRLLSVDCMFIKVFFLSQTWRHQQISTGIALKRLWQPFLQQQMKQTRNMFKMDRDKSWNFINLLTSVFSWCVQRITNKATSSPTRFMEGIMLV